MDARTTPLPPPAPTGPPTAPPAAPTSSATELPPPGTPPVAPPAPPAVGLPRPEPGTAGPPAVPRIAPVVEPVPVAPSRRRWPLFLALGVLAVVVVGVGALLVARDDGATVEVVSPDGADEPFSFAAATDRASEASSFRFDMTMSMPVMGEMRIDGAIDEPSGRMSMSTDLGATADELGGPTAFEMVLDLDAGVLYFGGSMADMFGDGSTSWVGVGLEEYAEMSGQGVDELRDSFVSDPSDLASVLDGLDAVEVGMEEIDGLPVKHYQVTVPVEDVLGADPQVADQLSGMGVDELDDLVYDVWVTEDNHLRRLAFDLDVDGMGFSTVMNLIEIGDAIDIPLPDPAEVTEIDDLLGDLGALGGLAD